WQDRRQHEAHRELSRQPEHTRFCVHARRRQDRCAGDKVMSDYLGLEGKRALVTGGTKGVGQAVVAALHEAGATALTTARSRPASLSKAEHFVVAYVSTVEGCAAVAD